MRQRCEHEIGRPGTWHLCNRLATVVSERTMGHSVWTVAFCKAHEQLAYRTDSRLVSVLRVRHIDTEA